MSDKDRIAELERQLTEANARLDLLVEWVARYHQDSPLLADDPSAVIDVARKAKP